MSTIVDLVNLVIEQRIEIERLRTILTQATPPPSPPIPKDDTAGITK